MTPRERFYRCVRHEQTDRAVFDLCGTALTSICEE